MKKKTNSRMSVNVSQFVDSLLSHFPAVVFLLDLSFAHLLRFRFHPLGNTESRTNKQRRKRHANEYKTPSTERQTSTTLVKIRRKKHEPN